MTRTNLQDVRQVLAAVERLRQQRGLSRHQLADQLGIAFNSFRAWFQTRGAKTPCRAHLSRLRAYVAAATQARASSDELWNRIREWWETQHRYSSLGQLSEEVGWPVDGLRMWLGGAASPPRLVVERVAQLVGLEVPAPARLIEEARRRSQRLKALLTIVFEELGWFRDGPEAVRGVFRSELDALDTGYVSSLLTMLSAEDKFRRWLELTTNRFNYFRRKEGPR